MFGEEGAEGCQDPALPRGVEAIPIYTGSEAALIHDRCLINSKQHEGPGRAEPLTP